MTLLYAREKNSETKEYEVINQEDAKRRLWKKHDVEFDMKTSKWYLAGHIPAAPEPTIDEQNEAIRATRELLYVQTSDKLKADYDEAVARGAENTEELKTAWLESKDKIREENPYIVESEEDVEEAKDTPEINEEDIIEEKVEEPVVKEYNKW